MEYNIHHMEYNIHHLEYNIHHIEYNIHHMEYNIHHIEYNIHHMEYNIHHMEYNIHHMEYNIHHMEYNIHHMEYNILHMEYNILHMEYNIHHMEYNIHHMEYNILHMEYNIHHMEYNIHHMEYNIHHMEYNIHHMEYNIHHMEYNIHHMEYNIHHMEFEAWKTCLSVLGIPFLDVIRVLAAVLLLGNVTFVEGQGLEVDIQGGSHELKSVASLLGVSSGALYRGLVTRTHNTRGHLVKSMCDANMSNLTRDALAKALYCRTVATIVRRANSLKRLGSTSGTLSSDSNESVHQNGDVASQHASTVGTGGSKASKSMSVLNSAVKHATDGFIGILDMFGFEDPKVIVGMHMFGFEDPKVIVGIHMFGFEDPKVTIGMHMFGFEDAKVIVSIHMFGFEDAKPAHLEHLCINLCAETMQHFYNTHIFKSSVESCREEGISSVVEVDYVDNVPCIDLISSLRTGLLSMLDVECSVRGTPESYIQKSKVQHKSCSRLFEPKGDLQRAFGIHHYAGRVVYEASDFLDTNRDIITDDLVCVFHKLTCTFGFATHLFGSEMKALFSQDSAPRGVSFRISPTSHTDLQNGDEPVSTLTQDFHTRLDNLLRTLVHAKPHFIRCIRANSTETPGIFDRATVIKQIRALQVLETVNLMAGGYPHRMRFRSFVFRYRLLAPSKRLRRTDEKTIEDCKMILEFFLRNIDDSSKSATMNTINWALGKRHIFLRFGSVA
ncbi:Myosin head motor domain [Trinorchestia longiramus]|nr:Myosin head motor domain [Trinorchestia longiramus]